MAATTAACRAMRRIAAKILWGRLAACGRLVIALPLACLFAQQPQNPSPMVEHTRAHPRLPERHPEGRREKLDLGTLYIPPHARPVLLVFFHAGTWLPEVAAEENRL